MYELKNAKTKLKTKAWKPHASNYKVTVPQCLALNLILTFVEKSIQK